jgi:transposase-like protein
VSPDRRVAVRIPEPCPHCGAFTTVKLETTVKGEAVLLMWCCRRCNIDWPVGGHMTNDELRLPNPH